MSLGFPDFAPPGTICHSMARNFLSILDLSAPELAELIDGSEAVKAGPEGFAKDLEGKTVAMIFEKPSTRTRISFEVAIATLGAHPLALSSSELQLGRGETFEDTGRVLSRYVDAVVVRTFGQERLEGLARTATVPIINALSDFEHPCQCLADLLTIREKKGQLKGEVLTYVGDGNNVTHSLLLAGAMSGMTVRVATPPGFEPIPQVVQRAREIGAEHGGGAELYCIVMHCLPAHRGQEITDEVIDGPHSVVWDQAENRLHTQKALLLWLLGRP